MGVVVVIIAVLFVVSLLKQTHHIQQTSSTATSATPAAGQPSELKQNGQKMYTVETGDDLWSISQKFYNSGYNWVDIAKANHITEPGMIFAGNKIILPNVTPQAPTVTGVPPSGQATQPTIQPINQISGTTYAVQKGDSLWDIAVRAYMDGYQWTKIAQANNLSDPNLIFSGNVLKIPR